MTMILGFLALSAGIAVMFSIAHIATKEVQTRRETPAVPDAGLPQGIQRELSKLPVSAGKIRKTAEAIEKMVTLEVQEKSRILREEMKRSFQEVVLIKEKALKEIRSDYENVSRRFETLGTEKKQTESVVRAVAEGRIVVNERGETVLVSPEAEKILRVKKEAVIGKPIIKTKGRETLLSFFGRLEESEEESLHTFSEDEETRRRLRGSSAVIESESGHTRGLISVLPEVIRENEIEDSKAQFIAGFSHELRTPLVCIQKSLRAVLEGAFGQVNHDQREYLGIASRNTAKLERMVGQILDFSRLEAGKIRLRPEIFSVAELIQELKEDFQAWASDKEITLAEEYDGTDFVMIADKDRLGQVLMNLLSNALKFTPKGGRVTVRAGLVAPQDIFLPPDGAEWMRFSVADTGPGIPESQRKRVFEKFVRLENPKAESVHGTGLGLSIAQAIVELHGGKIWVEPPDGRGCHVAFAIPKNSPI